MNNKDKDIFHKILYDEFDELTSNEKEELSRLYSNEQELFAIKKVLSVANNICEDQKNINISPKIKENLDKVFVNSNNKNKIWYNSTFIFLWNRKDNKNWYNQNLVKLVAILIIIIITIPFLTFKEKTTTQNASNIKPKESVQNQIKVNETEILNNYNQNFKKQVNTKDNNLDKYHEKPIIGEKETLVHDKLVEKATSENFVLKDEVEFSKIEVTSSRAETTGFNHPDGIYDDTPSSTSKKAIFIGNEFSVHNNSKLLDYIKTCY